MVLLALGEEGTVEYAVEVIAHDAVEGSSTVGLPGGLTDVTPAQAEVVVPAADLMAQLIVQVAVCPLGDCGGLGHGPESTQRLRRRRTHS
jgi:hypothetical protein